MTVRFNSVTQGKIGKQASTGADYFGGGEVFHRIFAEGDACRGNGSKYIFLYLCHNKLGKEHVGN